MPCTGCSALHGMNPSFYKIPNNHRMLKKIYGEYNFVAFFPDEIRNCSVTHPRHKCQNSLEKMNEDLMHCNTSNLRALSKNVSRRFSTIFCFLNQTVCVDLLGNKTNNFLFLIGTQAYMKEEFILVLLAAPNFKFCYNQRFHCISILKDVKTIRR